MCGRSRPPARFRWLCPRSGAETSGGCSTGWMGWCSRVVRISPPLPTAPNLTSSSARPSPASTPSSMRWRRRPFASSFPILGICRGAQTLNVARGGTLHQHLPDVVGDVIAHRQTVDGRVPTHPVTILPGSRLAAVVGHYSAERQLVPSPSGRPPRRPACVRAPGRRTGRSRRSRIRERPFVVAVQWHAETLQGVPSQLALFEELVTVAAGSTQLRQAA